MNVDASEHPRRLRSTSEPTGKRYHLNERKIRVIYAMRHGPVPTGLLVRPFFDGVPGNRHIVQKALTDLFHEPYEGETLVYRPDELNPAYNRWQQAVYAATAKGEDVAEIVRSVPQRDHERHRCMSACVQLSFEQLAPEHGFLVHDQEEIFADPRCPASTRLSENPLLIKVSDGHYEPDKLRSFESLTTGLYRFFIHEDCRGNVGFSRTDKHKNTNKRKLDHQLEVFDKRLYHSQWGIPSLSASWAMTKQADVDIALRYLKGKKHAERFYFKVLPQFSTKLWKYPKDPLEELFTEWQTVNGLKLITQP